MKYQVLVILTGMWTGNMNIGVLLLTMTKEGDSVTDVFSLELCAKSQDEV